jgi:hypothetical protein
LSQIISGLTVTFIFSADILEFSPCRWISATSCCESASILYLSLYISFQNWV